MSRYSAYARCVLEKSVGRPLDYGIPGDLAVTVGSLVEVPLRGKLVKGVVIEITKHCAFPNVKPVERILAGLPEDLLKLAHWMSDYYCCPLHNVLRTLLPSSVRKETGEKKQLWISRNRSRSELTAMLEELRKSFAAQARIIEVMLKVSKATPLSLLTEEAKTSRAPVDTLIKKGILKATHGVDPILDAQEYFLTKPKKLSAEQAEALDRVKASLDDNTYATHLLFGVTGSGKTEVYLQAIAHARAAGKGVILLVPEVALTEQTLLRLRSRFAEPFVAIHHRLSGGERRAAWESLRSGKVSIVVGARSAIFSPLPDLGLVIVDEEHDSSYKSDDETPSYHARDLAVMRGHLAKAPVILGSATPSFESYTNAKSGKYQLSKLSMRPEKSQMPEIHIVDMTREMEQAGGYTLFSKPLLDGIKKRAEVGEQSILFLNRRGYHTGLSCEACGETIECKHCSVALTYHRDAGALSCHLCGTSISPLPRDCPSCHQENSLKFRGVGTEQVERALHAVLSDIRTVRIDADTTRHKGTLTKQLRDFGNGKADVLIGTQMVAKGHHFSEVTLVGVLNSDGALNLPDFRSAENVFQLVTQVAGRAGRGSSPGEVIIQTLMPDNPTIQLAKKGDFTAFYEQEIESRKLFSFPPFIHLIKIQVSGPSEETVCQIISKLHSDTIQAFGQAIEILPPVPSGYAKVKDRFRYQFILKTPSVLSCTKFLRTFRDLSFPKGVRLSIDIDPNSTFF